MNKNIKKHLIFQTNIFLYLLKNEVIYKFIGLEYKCKSK